MEQLSPAVYWIKIPRHWKIHDVFHANLITPYKETMMHGPNYSRPLLDLVDGEKEFEVEQILGMKQMGKGRKTQYLVKWKGYPTSDNSWEPEKNLNVKELIAEFKQGSRPKKTKGRRIYLRMTQTVPISSSPFISNTTTPVVFRLPQLAIRTLPMPEPSEESALEVNYEAPQDQSPIPQAGFITNDPMHPFFYPIHVPNLTYRETDNTWTGTRTIVAPFIRYSPVTERCVDTYYTVMTNDSK